jgi:hypothetical protein
MLISPSTGPLVGLDISLEVTGSPAGIGTVVTQPCLSCAGVTKPRKSDLSSECTLTRRVSPGPTGAPAGSSDRVTTTSVMAERAWSAS